MYEVSKIERDVLMISTMRPALNELTLASVTPEMGLNLLSFYYY
jgi:hypothetical protein